MGFSTAHLLYGVFALGGMGILFLLPQGRQSRPRVGALFGALALLAWIVVAGMQFAGGDGVYFLVFSSIALAAGARVVTHQRPVYSALYFVLVVLAVAALLVLQQAEFLAIALIIVYAGAIMVTYLFVIMLAQQSGTPVYDGRAREPFLAVFMGFLLMAAIGGRAGDMVLPAKSSDAKVATLAQAAESKDAPSADAAKTAPVGNTAAMGAVLATEYVVVLEMSALLLLISMVGAIALSRKRTPREGYAVAPMPLGQIGRSVEPY